MNFSFPCLLSSYPYHKPCCLSVCLNLHFMYIASGFLVLILVVVLSIFNTLVLQAYLLVYLAITQIEPAAENFISHRLCEFQ